MRFEQNGRSFFIRDEVWDCYIKTALSSYGMTPDVMSDEETRIMIEDEAKLTYLEDEGIVINDEQQELIKATKGQRRENAKAEKPKDEPKKERKRTVKKDDDKINIINLLFELLDENDAFSRVEITNESKIVEFVYNGKPYKFDLVYMRNKAKSMGV